MGRPQVTCTLGILLYILGTFTAPSEAILNLKSLRASLCFKVFNLLFFEFFIKKSICPSCCVYNKFKTQHLISVISERYNVTPKLKLEDARIFSRMKIPIVLENIASQLCDLGHQIQFYNGADVTEDIICRGCEQAITESSHLLVNNSHYHNNHFMCRVCKVDLYTGTQPAYER